VQRITAAILVLTALAACQPTTPDLPQDQNAAIAAEVNAIFDRWPSFARAMDTEGHLEHFVNSEQLTISHPAGVLRSWSEYADYVRGKMETTASVDTLEFSEKRTWVIRSDVVVITAIGKQAMTDTAGDQVFGPTAFNGIWNTTWVKRNSRWQMIDMTIVAL
jgi:hypothetical protein